MFKRNQIELIFSRPGKKLFSFSNFGNLFNLSVFTTLNNFERVFSILIFQKIRISDFDKVIFSVTEKQRMIRVLFLILRSRKRVRLLNLTILFNYEKLQGNE